VFEEIVAGDDGASKLVPPFTGWRPYLKAALETPRLLIERKTGLKVPDVATVRLVRNDRG